MTAQELREALKNIPKDERDAFYFTVKDKVLLLNELTEAERDMIVKALYWYENCEMEHLAKKLEGKGLFYYEKKG